MQLPDCLLRVFLFIHSHPSTHPVQMAEKDPTARLRRAVKGKCMHFDSIHFSRFCTENNLFLVKRLIQRTDMRNPDPAPRRYTSLAWAAVLGHEETFEFLLTSAHDEHELSKVCNPLCAYPGADSHESTGFRKQHDPYAFSRPEATFDKPLLAQWKCRGFHRSNATNDPHVL